MFRLGHSRKMRELAHFLGLKNKAVASADLPCGYTCKMANICKAYADKNTGKIIDGKNMLFRCYGASIECAFPSTRKLHWDNFDALLDAGTSDKMTDVILDGINAGVEVLRIHSFGDFFSDDYFTAWLNVTEKLSHIKFFAYTKILPYLKMNRPNNFSMVYSYGGLCDNDLTDEPAAYVVNTIADAINKNVPVSCQNHPADDFDFIQNGKSFALLLHGVQPRKK